MKILVVENEIPAAERIVRMLKKLDKTIVITDIIETVEGTISRLQEGPRPDLIMMDIQLDDGLCFEIFETISVDIPVIFTTAYDEYTLRAFRVNSLDYLLKPVEEDALRTALDKYRKLYADKSPFRADFRHLLNEFREQYKGRFLIRIRDKFKSVPVKDIVFFHITRKSTFIRDIRGRDYGIDYSLEQIEGMLDPRKFFRINRECIVNIDSISLMHSYSSSRLQLSLKNADKTDLFVVSREKVGEFKKWIDRGLCPVASIPGSLAVLSGGWESHSEILISISNVHKIVIQRSVHNSEYKISRFRSIILKRIHYYVPCNPEKPVVTPVVVTRYKHVNMICCE